MGTLWACTYSNSMWHTDYKVLDDGRRVLCLGGGWWCITVCHGMASLSICVTTTEKRAGCAWGGHRKPRQACICSDWLWISVMCQCLRGKEEEKGHQSLRKSWLILEYNRSWQVSEIPRPTVSWRGCTVGFSAIYQSLRQSWCARVSCGPVYGTIQPQETAHILA